MDDGEDGDVPPDALAAPDGETEGVDEPLVLGEAAAEAEGLETPVVRGDVLELEEPVGYAEGDTHDDALALSVPLAVGLEVADAPEVRDTLATAVGEPERELAATHLKVRRTRPHHSARAARRARAISTTLAVRTNERCYNARGRCW